MANKSASEIRQDITNKIVDSLSQNVLPWRKSWSSNGNSGIPTNFLNKRRYSGINSLILMCESLDKGYTTKYWGTANAVMQKIGAHVTKGEKSSSVTFFKMMPMKNDLGVAEKDSKGNDKFIPLLREYPIFNIQQFQPPTVESLLDGKGSHSLVKTMLGDMSKTARKQETTEAELRQIAKRYLKQQPSKNLNRQKLAEFIHEGIQESLNELKGCILKDDLPNYQPADELIQKSKANIKHGGDRAFYAYKPRDYIAMPQKSDFETMTDYYQTLFHELAHWTMTDDRVGRTNKFEEKEETYAFEELVAELSACFVLTEIGVPLAETVMTKSQSYLKNWLSKMKDDSKYIFAASTQASKVVDYLLGFVGKQNPDYDDDYQDKQVA